MYYLHCPPPTPPPHPFSHCGLAPTKKQRRRVGGRKDGEKESRTIYASHFLFSLSHPKKTGMSPSPPPTSSASLIILHGTGWFLLFSTLFVHIQTFIYTTPHRRIHYIDRSSVCVCVYTIYQRATSFLSRHSPGDALSLRTFFCVCLSPSSSLLSQLVLVLVAVLPLLLLLLLLLLVGSCHHHHFLFFFLSFWARKISGL